MMDRFNFVPTFDTPQLEALKIEIQTSLPKFVVKLDGETAPIVFDWKSIVDYPAGAQRTVVSAIKNNLSSICNQIIAGVEKVDLKNKSQAYAFVKVVVIQNAQGKSAASKKATLGTDGVLILNTIFEDGLNCANYLEKKVTQALNEFRAPAGVTTPILSAPTAPVVAPTPAQAPAPSPAPISSPSPSISSPSPSPSLSYPSPAPSPVSPTPSPVTSASPTPSATTATPTPSGPSPTDSAFFLLYPEPVYGDATSDQLKKDISAALRTHKLKLDPAAVGGDISVPFVFDYNSLSTYAPGSQLNGVLRGVKGAINSICQQIISAFDKVDSGSRQKVHTFLLGVVIQNTPGKAASSKKATMFTDGGLIVNTVFEDAMNCPYYMEKKVQVGIEEFRVPPGVNPPTREAGASAAFVAASPAVTSPSPSPSPTPTACSPTPSSPTPIAAPVQVTPASPPPEPKPKGRPEMAGIPEVDDKNLQHLMREAQALVNTRVIVDDTGAPVGAPILIDWKSILVYSGSKQSTIVKTVQNTALKLGRDIVNSLKAACFDPAVKNAIVVYLRSVTISNISGTTASNAKKVVFEDGHLTLYTIFEDANNCTSYFESKIATEMGVRQKGPPAAAANPVDLLKDEVESRLGAHYDTPNQKLVPVGVPVQLKWDLLTARQKDDLMANIAAAVTPLMCDFLGAMYELKGGDIDIVRQELKAIHFSTGKDKKITFGDDGVFSVITNFDDRVGCSQGMKEKYAEAFKIKLQKVIIRDTLIPAFMRQVAASLQVPVKVNPYIPVQAFHDVKGIPITFDWLSLHHFNLTPEYQITNFGQIILTLDPNAPFMQLIRESFDTVCGYDVGKLAVMNKINQIIFKHVTKPKEQRVYLDSNGILDFTMPFNSFKDMTPNKISLVSDLKTMLGVQIPCSAQDTVEDLAANHARLKKVLGTDVGMEIVWSSFVNDHAFTNHFDQYKKTKKIVVENPASGLFASNSLATLCEDNLVKQIAAEKIKNVKIVIDPQNYVARDSHRPRDPNVIAKWEGSTLVFTLNLNDGLDAQARMPGWAYTIERALDTRPKKVSRAIEEHKKKNIPELEQRFKEVLKTNVAVDVRFEEFIHTNEFLNWLEEHEYLFVLSNITKTVPDLCFLNPKSDAFVGLAKYKNVLPIIQQKVDGLIIHVDVKNSAAASGTLKYENKKLVLHLNLNTLTSAHTNFSGFRVKLEQLLELRLPKIREEISYIDAPAVSKTLSNVIGSPVNVVVDWESVISSPEFADNNDTYINLIHAIGEDIVEKNLSKNQGFGVLCEYEEVKRHIQNNLKEIKIVCEANEGDVSFRYNSGTKSLLLTFRMSKMKSPCHNSDFEYWGRKIENAMLLRPLRVQGTIDRQSKKLSEVVSKLDTIFNKRLAVVIEWDSLIESSEFKRLDNYMDIIARICGIPAVWGALDSIAATNHEMRDIIASNVHTFSLVIDPRNLVNEPRELAEYGAAYVQVRYKEFSTKNEITTTINLSQVLKDNLAGMETELKIELLVTPEHAKARAKEKREEERDRQEREDRRDAAWREEQYRRDSLSAMKEQTRQIERLRRR